MAKYWTNEEEAYLQKHWDEFPIEHFIEVLDKPYEGIRRKAIRLGLNAKKDTKDLLVIRWSLEEDTIINENFFRCSKKTLLELLPNRTWIGIESRARELGFVIKYKPWLDEEKEYLMKSWESVCLEDMMEYLGRTERAITTMGGSLGLQTKALKKLSKRSFWSEEDKAYVKVNWETTCIEDMMVHLDRTEWSIIRCGTRQGLDAKNVARRTKFEEIANAWTEEQMEYITEKWGLVSTAYLCKKLNRDIKEVEKMANKLNLNKQLLQNADYLTVADVAEILSVSTRTIYTWIEESVLKSKKVKITTKTKVLISFDEFISFLTENRDKWNACKADMVFIKSCFSTCFVSASGDLNIKIPVWLDEKAEADKSKAPVIKKPWTKSEEKRAVAMKKSGLSFTEIAKTLNRGYDSVCKKVTRLLEEEKENFLMDIREKKSYQFAI